MKNYSNESQFTNALDRITGGLGTWIKEATGGIGDLVKALLMIEQGTASSLTQYSKRSNIMSRVYVEDSIANSPIAIPLVGALNQLFVSYVLAALNLNTVCIGGRTVQELTQIVASENLGNKVVDPVKRILEDNKQEPNTVSLESQSGIFKLDDDAQRLVAGRVIELDMAAPIMQGEEYRASQNFKTYLYVQLVPYILNKQTSNEFFISNFTPSIKVRYDALRAGEIKFWRDFIFARDLIEQQAKVIKNDKSGVLTEILNTQRNKLFRFIAGILDIMPESHNIANSVMIVDKNTFMDACSTLRIDFNKYDVRQKFFNKTFTMIIAIVDTMYDQVDMYFNGINQHGSYTGAMINKVGAKGKDNFDLKEVMQAFSQGMSPKF